MSERKINLWRIIDRYPMFDINHPNHNNGAGDTVVSLSDVYKIAKEVAQEILELAADNAECDVNYYGESLVNKQSILNVINLIE